MGHRKTGRVILRSNHAQESCSSRCTSQCHPRRHRPYAVHVIGLRNNDAARRDERCTLDRGDIVWLVRRCRVRRTVVRGGALVDDPHRRVLRANAGLLPADRDRVRVACRVRRIPHGYGAGRPLDGRRAPLRHARCGGHAATAGRARLGVVRPDRAHYRCGSVGRNACHRSRGNRAGAGGLADGHGSRW